MEAAPAVPKSLASAAALQPVVGVVEAGEGADLLQPPHISAPGPPHPPPAAPGVAAAATGHAPPGDAQLAPLPQPPPCLWGTVRVADVYERLDAIGEGQYGSVFSGRDRASGSLVALKKVNLASEREGFPTTACREVLILSSLEHAHVVRLVEVVSARPCSANAFRGSIFLVLEYADHDLQGYCGRPGLQLGVHHVACISHQIVFGLAYCHSRGVLHRDLKPSNILINNRGIVKLADFGLARAQAAPGAPRADWTTAVVTLWYRAPELLLGARAYGPEIDVWSAGCIIGELLLRAPLFPGSCEADTAALVWDTAGAPCKPAWPGAAALPFHKHLAPERAAPRRVRERILTSPVVASAGTALGDASAAAAAASSAASLVDCLLQLDPARRATAEGVLNHPFLRFACAPPLLPRFAEPCHEADVKRRKIAAKAAAADEARAELEATRAAEAAARAAPDVSDAEAAAAAAAAAAPPPPPVVVVPRVTAGMGYGGGGGAAAATACVWPPLAPPLHPLPAPLLPLSARAAGGQSSAPPLARAYESVAAAECATSATVAAAAAAAAAAPPFPFPHSHAHPHALQPPPSLFPAASSVSFAPAPQHPHHHHHRPAPSFVRPASAAPQFYTRAELEAASPAAAEGVDAAARAAHASTFVSFLDAAAAALASRPSSTSSSPPIVDHHYNSSSNAQLKARGAPPPRPVLYTAAVYCHRFFAVRSQSDHDNRAHLIGAAALLLAGKVEGAPRTATDVAVASYAARVGPAGPDLGGEAMAHVLPGERSKLLDAERRLATAIGFALGVGNPVDAILQAAPRVLDLASPKPPPPPPPLPVPPPLLQPSPHPQPFPRRHAIPPPMPPPHPPPPPPHAHARSQQPAHTPPPPPPLPPLPLSQSRGAAMGGDVMDAVQPPAWEVEAAAAAAAAASAAASAAAAAASPSSSPSSSSDDNETARRRRRVRPEPASAPAAAAAAAAQKRAPPSPAKALISAAVGFANDSARTSLCLQHPAGDIALGCLLLGARLVSRSPPPAAPQAQQNTQNGATGAHPPLAVPHVPHRLLLSLDQLAACVPRSAGGAGGGLRGGGGGGGGGFGGGGGGGGNSAAAAAARRARLRAAALDVASQMAEYYAKHGGRDMAAKLAPLPEEQEEEEPTQPPPLLPPPPLQPPPPLPPLPQPQQQPQLEEGQPGECEAGESGGVGRGAKRCREDGDAGDDDGLEAAEEETKSMSEDAAMVGNGHS